MTWQEDQQQLMAKVAACDPGELGEDSALHGLPAVCRCGRRIFLVVDADWVWNRPGQRTHWVHRDTLSGFCSETADDRAFPSSAG